MSKKRTLFPALLLCLLLLAGCSGQSPSASVDAAPLSDISQSTAHTPAHYAQPCVYQGAGSLFSVRCIIRPMTETEHYALVQMKTATLNQLILADKQHPQQDRTALIDALREDLNTLRRAAVLFVTELTASPVREGLPASTPVSYSLSADGRVCLAAQVTAGTALWSSGVSTPDCAYTEGSLLPGQKQYTMTITMGAVTESFPLNLQ